MRILPVSAESHGDSARQLCRSLVAQGVRAEVSDRGTLGSRVRESREVRDSYQVIIGDTEVADQSVSISAPATGAKATLPVGDFVTRLTLEIHGRRRHPEVPGRERDNLPT